MRIFFLLLLFSLNLTFELQSARQWQTTRSYAIETSIKVNNNPKSITISWLKKPSAITYFVSRKTIDSDSWGAPIAQLDSSKTSYTDLQVIPGANYEYEVSAVCEGFYNTKVNNKDTTLPINYYAWGYSGAALESKPIHSFGKVLLLIDETLSDQLYDEILTLENDLISEGWWVVKRNVPRAEEFNGKAVKDVKSIIMEEYEKDYELTSLILIGRVPVPYSGNFNPDAHPDHQGAWPADVYYSSLVESEWTDDDINNEKAYREENKNIPNDGKFDQSMLNLGDSWFMIGRIDLYNLPEFKKSELELLKSYFKRNHEFRTGNMQLGYKAVVDDNFGMYTLEAFGQNGWRNFAPLVGAENVKEDDFFSKLGTENYLFSYGCGGGSYISAGGVGTTTDFASKSVNGIFSLLFGSYFGDWDAKNNFLRAPLASSPGVLTCGWAGRPSWYMHHLGLGFPIGYSAKLSQNNTNLYKPNAYISGTSAQIVQVGLRGVHIALMGDPTLKFYNEYILPPSNLSVINKDIQTRELNWEPSKSTGEILYSVYKSYKREGPYKVIAEQINKTNFVDKELYEGKIYYMVRAAKLIESLSGKQYQLSRGILEAINVTNVTQNNEFSIELSPNPTSDNLNISLNLNFDDNYKIELLSSLGIKCAELFNSNLNSGNHYLSFNLKKFNLANGTYFIKIKSNNKNQYLKLIILN